MRRNASHELFKYDVTGGRYEESDFAATTSGSLHASTVIKLGYEEDQGRDAAIDLAITAIFQAADEDSATGGPDLVQGIFPPSPPSPPLASVVAEDEVGDRFRGLVERLSLPHGDIEAPPGGGVPGGERR